MASGLRARATTSQWRRRDRRPGHRAGGPAPRPGRDDPLLSSVPAITDRTLMRCVAVSRCRRSASSPSWRVSTGSTISVWLLLLSSIGRVASWSPAGKPGSTPAWRSPFATRNDPPIRSAPCPVLDRSSSPPGPTSPTPSQRGPPAPTHGSLATRGSITTARYAPACRRSPGVFDWPASGQSPSPTTTRSSIERWRTSAGWGGSARTPTCSSPGPAAGSSSARW